MSDSSKRAEKMRAKLRKRLGKVNMNFESEQDDGANVENELIKMIEEQQKEIDKLKKKKYSFEDGLNIGSENENKENKFIMLTSKLTPDVERELLCTMLPMAGVQIHDCDLIRVRNFVQKIL